MKVLYIVSTLERCGPNNVLYNIIKHAKFEYLKEYCEVVYLPRTPNISTT